MHIKSLHATSYAYKIRLNRISQTVTHIPGKTEPEMEGQNAYTNLTVEMYGKLYFHQDRIGSTIRMTRENGQTIAWADYDEWGVVRSPLGHDMNVAGVDNAVGFTSYTYDIVLDVHFAQARMYDPSNRRFMSVDPIKDSLNWYAYCGNNPTTYIDILGLEEVPEWADRINQGKGTKADYVKALAPQTKSYAGYVEQQVNNAIKKAKDSYAAKLNIVPSWAVRINQGKGTPEDYQQAANATYDSYIGNARKVVNNAIDRAIDELGISYSNRFGEDCGANGSSGETREKVMITDWLIGFKGTPVTKGKSIDLKVDEWKKLDQANRDNNRQAADWYSFEPAINPSALSQYANAGKTLQANPNPIGNGLINEDGRYWIAVGPEVANPGYNAQYPAQLGTLNESQFKYGAEVDVVLRNSLNEIVYIQCVIGDIKAHTYPSGVFQTGTPYPYSANKNEDGSAHINGSYIEFCGFPINEKPATGSMSKYEVIEIILYERRW